MKKIKRKGKNEKRLTASTLLLGKLEEYSTSARFTGPTVPLS